MKLPRFDLFVGIDQTGAAIRGGAGARPLHVVVLARSSGRWRLLSRSRSGAPLRLPRLGHAELKTLLRDALGGEGRELSRVALIADCVFGIAGGIPAWELIARTLATGVHGAVFGREPARAYFERVLREEYPGRREEPWPRRLCERLSGANSVFQTHPFQKNIQTGTYRIWRDLAEGAGRPGEKWVNLWPFETARSARADRPWLFEAYPSLLWRQELAVPTRKLAALREAVESRLGRSGCEVDDWKLILASPDLADAAVLALGGWLLQREGRLFEPEPGFRRRREPRAEGWILGLRRGSRIVRS